jgi:hypothetical protein
MLHDEKTLRKVRLNHLQRDPMKANDRALSRALVARGAEQSRRHTQFYRNVANELPSMVEVRFYINEDALPSLYSAVEEISNEVGARLEAPHRYEREDALVRAARGLAALREGIARTSRTLDATRKARDKRWRSPLGDKDYR